jgi:hypothetical protein
MDRICIKYHPVLLEHARARGTPLLEHDLLVCNTTDDKQFFEPLFLKPRLSAQFQSRFSLSIVFNNQNLLTSIALRRFLFLSLDIVVTGVAVVFGKNGCATPSAHSFLFPHWPAEKQVGPLKLGD